MTIKAVQQFELQDLGSVLNRSQEIIEEVKDFETEYVGKAKNYGVKAIILESYRNWIDNSPIKSFQVSADFLNKYV